MRKTEDKKALIVVKQLRFAYERELIIKDADFSVNRGDFITIVGPNGGGKTTLVRLLMGQLKPDSGKVYVSGKNSRVFGYVPQYTTMDPSYPITLLEVVLTGRIKSFGFYGENDKKAAKEALFSVGLKDMSNSSFFELSGGQKQRGLIARALVSNPEILILDEPTANIDAESEKQLNGILKNLTKGQTILVVTHDLAFVNEMSTRVLCVNRSVKEHPLESIEDGVFSSVYGRRLKVVKHEEDLLKRGSK